MDRVQDLADAPCDPGAQALLFALFDAAADAILLLDESDAVAGCNPAAEALLGWPRGEVIGQPFAQLCLAQDDQGARQPWRDRHPSIAAVSDRGQSAECLLRRRDGRHFAAALSVTNARGFTVVQVRALAAPADAEATRGSAHEWLRSFVANAPLPMYVFSREGRFELANGLAAEYHGRAADALLALEPAEIGACWPEFHAAVRSGSERVIATGEPATVETVLFSARHHAPRSMQLTLFPVVHGANGSRAASLIGAIALDITDMIGARRELERTAAELRGQRTLFRAFVDNAPIPMSANRHDGSFVFANRRSAEFHGVSVAQMLELDMEAMRRNVPGFAENILAPGQRPFATGETFVNETEVFSRVHGEMRTVQFTFFPIHEDVDGERGITLVGTICYDVTEIRRAQQDQARVSARLTQFFEHAPMAVSLADRDGRLLLVNQAGANHLGASADTLVGKSIQGLTNMWVNADEAQAMIARMQSGSAIRFAAEFGAGSRAADVAPSGVDRGDTWRIMDMTFFPIRDARGEITEIGTFALDVTQVRRAQDRLAAQQAALHQSEKLAALGQLLAGVAHELNNPLAIVKGRAAILKEKLAGTAHEAAITKLGDAADRCARIVKTFLAMARKVGPQRAAVDINDLVRGVLDLTASGLRHARVDVQTVLDPALREIDTDGDQLMQALINLVVNAQHALEDHAGVRRLRITTRLEQVNERVLIEVADTGPGIPAHMAARVFEPFFTSKDVGKGTGLGLSVCKGMVEANGGELQLVQTAGGGATFRIFLPRVAPSAQDPATTPPPSVRAPRTLRALVIDDEPDLAEILAESLGALGFMCATASNGREALEALSRQAFDAIFCDVRMPEMDGMAFYNALERDHPEQLPRLAFVSGDLLHGDVVRLTAEARCPVIEKPFDPEQIRATALALIAGERQ